METAQDLLTAQPFLEGMTDRQLERLSYYAHRSMFHAGNRVFREGGHADRCWLIQRGRVHLDTHIPGRGDVVVETLGPNAVLGWSWLFPPYRWHFGAVAAEPTFTLALDGPGLRRLCDDDPTLGYDLTTRFMRVVVERLQATRIRLLDLYPEPS